MGAAPVPQNVKRNTRKRRRKRSIRKRRRKRKRRKNESTSLPSQTRVQTQNDKELTDLVGILFCKIKHCGQRCEDCGVREEQEGHQERKSAGGTGADSQPPSRRAVSHRRGSVSCQVPALESGWCRAGKLFSLSSSLLITVVCDCLEMPLAGWPDQGTPRGSSSRCCAASTLHGGHLTPLDFRLDFPLLLRIIKAHYLLFKSIYFLIVHACASNLKGIQGHKNSSYLLSPPATQFPSTVATSFTSFWGFLVVFFKGHTCSIWKFPG